MVPPLVGPNTPPKLVMLIDAKSNAKAIDPVPVVRVRPVPTVTKRPSYPVPLLARIKLLVIKEANPVPPLITGIAKFISPDTKLLNVGWPDVPLGLAKNLLAVCEAKVAVKLPDDITGLPLTVNILGNDNPTLVTVPAPAPAIAVSKLSIAALMRLKFKSSCA